MEIIRKKLNRSCKFHDVNQGDEEITRMLCSIYFGFINAKYNGVIKSFSEDDIREVAQLQCEKGLLDYKYGGKSSDGMTSVFDWLNKNGYDCNLGYTKNDSEVKEWVKRGYAIGIGIMVNSTFYQDTKDGSLDLEDYSKYKGTTNHFTNIIKRTCIGAFDCETNGQEMILDSYFVKNSTYVCDIDKILANIDMTTKYIIY